MKKLVLAILFSLGLLANGWAFTGAPKDDANCVGAWTMDVDENPIQDISPNNNDANLKGANEPDFATASPPDTYSTGYYTWDGTDDYIQGTSAFTLTNAISFVLWANVNTGTWDDYATFINEPWDNGAIWNDPYIRIFFGRQAATTSGRIAICKVSTSLQGGWYSASGYWINGVWHHYAVTRTGTTIIFYVDGVIFDDAPTSDNGAADNIAAGNGEPYMMGMRSTDSPGEYFGGSMDEPAVFSDVLTSTEINDIMDNGLAGSAPPVSLTIGAILNNAVLNNCFIQ